MLQTIQSVTNILLNFHLRAGENFREVLARINVLLDFFNNKKLYF